VRQYRLFLTGQTRYRFPIKPFEENGLACALLLLPLRRVFVIHEISFVEVDRLVVECTSQSTGILNLLFLQKVRASCISV